MANEQFEKLVVQLSADLRSYQNGMAKAVGVTNARAREIENRYKQMNASISRAVAAPIAGLGAALSVREVARYADAWTVAGNKIAASAEYAGVQTRSLELLRREADSARTSIEVYSDLYAKMARSSSGVAESEQEIATATNLVAKAMKAGGAATQEQQAAILQLGQALGSGVLQGDELRSLRENAPVLAQAIADEFGVTIAGLKKLGEEGKLTSDRVFKAILNAQAPIEAQFAKTNATIADSFTTLRNSVVEYVGKANETLGITETVGRLMAALAGNFDSIATAAAAAGAVLLGSYVPAMGRAAAAGAVMVATNPFLALAAGIGAAAFALTAFEDDLKPVQGDLATIGDYAAEAWSAISDGVGAATTAISDAFLGAINFIADAIGGLPVTWTDVLATIKDIVNTWIGVHVAAGKTIAAALSGIPSVVADMAISAMNGMIGIIEGAINEIVREVNLLPNAINAASEALGFEAVLPTLDPVTLGRLQNDYAGAGARLGEAVTTGISDAMNKDYLGDALSGVRARAEERAMRRSETAGTSFDGASTEGFGGGLDLGSSAGAGAGGGKGGKGRRGRKNELEREIEQIKERTASLVAETQAQAGLNPLIDDYGYAATKAAAAQDLLSSAEQAGIAVTPELRAQIDELAEAYAQATVTAGQLGESQEQIRRNAEDMRSSMQDASQGFIKDLLDGKNAADALASAIGRIGDKLLDIGLDTLFSAGKAGAGGGLFSGLVSGIGKLFGFAEGGYTGPGGRSQPAGVVHAGEYVFSAPAVRAMGVPRLEAMHRLAKRGYAEGGYVGRASAATPAGGMDGTLTIKPSPLFEVEMTGVADGRVKVAAPRIVGAAVGQANRSVVPTMAKYQHDVAGGEWRF